MVSEAVVSETAASAGALLVQPTADSKQNTHNRQAMILFFIKAPPEIG
jgi:hypothetical protein